MAVCTTTLPTASADQCTTNLFFGPIDKFMFTRAEATDALTDVSDDSEWTTRLSNSTALASSGTAAAIRYLYVIGEWPLPERTDVEVSDRRDAQTVPKHTITLDVDDTGLTNAALLTSLQNTTQYYKVWVESAGLLYGGNGGVEASVTFLGRVIPRGRNDKQIIQVRVQFYGAMPTPIATPLTDVI
ncbi:MAG: hypothetical protein KDC70_00180 [Saprospiraceae bacterium]|nr:hypothetical protein [Saprospiraceae bacterium]